MSMLHELSFPVDGVRDFQERDPSQCVSLVTLGIHVHSHKDMNAQLLEL